MKLFCAPAFLKTHFPTGCGPNTLNGTLLKLFRQSSINQVCFAANLMAVSLLTFFLTANSNLASTLIEGFWVIMSAVAVLSSVRRVHAPCNGDMETPTWIRGFGPRRLGQ